MDLTTVALGYGLEYSFTIHERARHAALMGDDELQQPTISAASNAWVAREARTKMDEKFGPREFRGPLWETTQRAHIAAGRSRHFHGGASYHAEYAKRNRPDADPEGRRNAIRNGHMLEYGQDMTRRNLYVRA